MYTVLNLTVYFHTTLNETEQNCICGLTGQTCYILLVSALERLYPTSETHVTDYLYHRIHMFKYANDASCLHAGDCAHQMELVSTKGT